MCRSVLLKRFGWKVFALPSSVKTSDQPRLLRARQLPKGSVGGYLRPSGVSRCWPDPPCETWVGHGQPTPWARRKRDLDLSTIRETWRRQRGQGTAPARLADSEVSHGEITRRQTRSTGLPGAGDAVDPVVDVGLAVVPDRVLVEPARSDAPTGAPARNPSGVMEAAPRIRSPPTFRGAALRELTFWSAIRRLPLHRV
jgi:hypothetical protein